MTMREFMTAPVEYVASEHVESMAKLIDATARINQAKGLTMGQLAGFSPISPNTAKEVYEQSRAFEAVVNSSKTFDFSQSTSRNTSATKFSARRNEGAQLAVAEETKEILEETLQVSYLQLDETKLNTAAAEERAVASERRELEAIEFARRADRRAEIAEVRANKAEARADELSDRIDENHRSSMRLTIYLCITSALFAAFVAIGIAIITSMPIGEKVVTPGKAVAR